MFVLPTNIIVGQGFYDVFCDIFILAHSHCIQIRSIFVYVRSLCCVSL